MYVREDISRTTCQNVTNCVHITCGRGSFSSRRHVRYIRFYGWRHIAHKGQYGGTSIQLQRVTSLRRHAQAKTPAASYWLRRVLDDGERRDRTSPSCKGCRGRSLQCTIVLFHIYSSTVVTQCSSNDIISPHRIRPISTDVRRSLCVCVFRTTGAVYRRLNRSRCCLDGGLARVHWTMRGWIRLIIPSHRRGNLTRDMLGFPYSNQPRRRRWCASFPAVISRPATITAAADITQRNATYRRHCFGHLNALIVATCATNTMKGHFPKLILWQLWKVTQLTDERFYNGRPKYRWHDLTAQPTLVSLTADTVAKRRRSSTNPPEVTSSTESLDEDVVMATAGAISLLSQDDRVMSVRYDDVSCK